MAKNNGIGIRVDLTDEEILRIEDAAAERNVPKRRLGIPRTSIDRTHTLQEIDRLGVSGEMAAAKLLDLTINDESLIYGDNGVDLITPRGLTIDVKTCRLRKWNFAILGTDLKFFKADIGILVWALSHNYEYEVVGWTTKVHFGMNYQITDFGYGERFFLPWTDMLDIQKLVDAMKGGKL
jgi:hypothetical protein